MIERVVLARMHGLTPNSVLPDRHLARPLAVDPQPKTPILHERGVDQFHSQPLSSEMVLNDQPVERFGTSHCPFYPLKRGLSS